MSVLSRPVRHRTTAPTQRTSRVPLQRGTTTSAPPTTAPPITPPITPPSRPRPAAMPQRDGIRPSFLLAGVLAALAVTGATTYALIDDGGGTASSTTTRVDVPAPNSADLARDRAAAERGNDAQRATDLARDRAAAERGNDAQRASDAARDAAVGQRRGIVE